jgi:hypothetical protein
MEMAFLLAIGGVLYVIVGFVLWLIALDDDGMDSLAKAAGVLLILVTLWPLVLIIAFAYGLGEAISAYIKAKNYRIKKDEQHDDML